MEWIKVSERLPDTSMRVLVTEEYHTERGNYRVVGEIYYDADCQLFYSWDAYLECENVREEVIAWVPMPKPYQGE